MTCRIMKRFVKQLFDINLIQLVIILLLGGFQFLANAYTIKIPDTAKGFVFIGALALLIIAAGVAGIVANLEGSYELWEEKARSSAMHKRIAFFIQASCVVAFSMFYLLYMSISYVSPIAFMLLSLVVIIVRNGMEYFRKKNLPAE